MDKITSFWQRFLQDTNRPSTTPYASCFHFELTEKLAKELLELVLKGQKKATASSVNAYEIEKEPLPKVGNLNIITDWNGNPKCVIETKAITILPFKEITYEICKREGEDDTLESWRRGHVRFYQEEGKQLGYTFTDELLVIFEDFEMVYPVNKDKAS